MSAPRDLAKNEFLVAPFSSFVCVYFNQGEAHSLCSSQCFGVEGMLERERLDSTKFFDFCGLVGHGVGATSK